MMARTGLESCKVVEIAQHGEILGGVLGETGVNHTAQGRRLLVAPFLLVGDGGGAARFQMRGDQGERVTRVDLDVQLLKTAADHEDGGHRAGSFRWCAGGGRQWGGG
jgi:hypothetical protein